jgi:hypothetical protein
MAKTISAEGKTYSVPDDATDDEINQIVGPPGSSAPPSLTPGAPGSEAAGRFAAGAGNEINPLPGIGAALSDPVGTAKALWHRQGDQFTKAKADLSDTSQPLPMRMLSAAGHGAAGLLPLVGPEAADIGDQIGSGDVAGGMGRAAGLIGTMGLGALPEARGASVARPLSNAAEHLYGRSLKPPVSLSVPDARALVQTGLRERIPVTEGGLDKTTGLVNGINQDISSKVQGSPFQVDPNRVARRVDDIMPKFQEQVNPERDVKALQGARAEYLRQHTTNAPFSEIRPGTEEETGNLVPTGRTGYTPIVHLVPADAAQAEKVGTYRQLAGKYGELGNADVEAQKALARGNKEELGAGIPWIQPLNEREGKLLDLQAPLERAVRRNANRDNIPIGGTAVSLAKKVFDNPGLQSHAALALHGAAENPYLSGIVHLVPAAGRRAIQAGAVTKGNQ